MGEALRPAVYRLHDQTDQVGSLPSGIVVRTTVESASIVSAVRQAIWSVDKNQPIWRVQTLEEIVDRQLSTPAQSTTLMSAFALLALLLASLGLYGVLSYAVTQRTNEDRRTHGVRRDVQGDTALLRQTRLGIDAHRTRRWLGPGGDRGALDDRAALWVPARLHPNCYVVSLILLAVATLAWFVPARRASRVDPMIALRNE